MRFGPALAVENHRNVPPVEGRLRSPEVDRKPEVNPRRRAVDAFIETAIECLARALIDGAACRENQRIRDGITVKGNVAAGPEAAALEGRRQEIIRVGITSPP